MTSVTLSNGKTIELCMPSKLKSIPAPSYIQLSASDTLFVGTRSGSPITTVYDGSPSIPMGLVDSQIAHSGLETVLGILSNVGIGTGAGGFIVYQPLTAGDRNSPTNTYLDPEFNDFEISCDLYFPSGTQLGIDEKITLGRMQGDGARYMEFYIVEQSGQLYMKTEHYDQSWDSTLRVITSTPISTPVDTWQKYIFRRDGDSFKFVIKNASGLAYIDTKPLLDTMMFNMTSFPYHTLRMFHDGGTGGYLKQRKFANWNYKQA